MFCCARSPAPAREPFPSIIAAFSPKGKPPRKDSIIFYLQTIANKKLNIHTFAIHNFIKTRVPLLTEIWGSVIIVCMRKPLV